MTSVVELFPKSRKLTYDLRQQLSQVQNDILSSSVLNITIDELKRQLDLLEQLLHKETPAQREMWRRKILELREEASSIQRQSDYYHRMVNANVRIQKEREALLTRRNRRNNNSGLNAQGQEKTMNNLNQESQSLANSTNMIGEILVNGQNQLNELVDQRNRMRGVKRTVLNMGFKIGLSNATMEKIRKMDDNDANLVFGGMVVTCIIIYIVWLR
jgi:Golgi SNAP receptor complex protein 2